jgi:hypothetical protein
VLRVSSNFEDVLPLSADNSRDKAYLRILCFPRLVYVASRKLTMGEYLADGVWEAVGYVFKAFDDDIYR